MKIASCDNCAHRKELDCGLGLAPAEGEFLCHRYAMTTAFRDEVIELARREYARDFNQAMVEVSIMKAERAKGFAG